MRLFLTALLAISLMTFSFSAGAATDGVTAFKAAHPAAKLVYGPLDAAPRLIHRFAAPMPQAMTPQAQARQFVSENKALFGLREPDVELTLKKTVSLAHQTVVKYGQVYNGVPVLDSALHVVVDNAGRVVRVHNYYKPVSQRLSTTPMISRSEAITTAWASVYAASTYNLETRATDERNTQLYVWHLGSQAHLVWLVAMPHPLRTEKRIALIDADTGEFLMQKNLVVYSKANVYQANPGQDGGNATAEVELDGLSPDQDFTAGPMLRAVNCPDKGEIRQINIGININVPMCTEEHIAQADASGDFKYEPVLTGWSDPASHDDPFSEVHMYYHATTIYNYFRELATHVNADNPPFEHLNQVPFHAVSNFKMPDINALMGGGNVTLIPFDNAFFVPAYGLIPDEYPESDAIVFGQGTLADFAYDGEVIYHEFTHAMIDSVVGLESITADQYGLSTDPGAMNEGYADYFASTFAGDPSMAEYLGASFENGSSEDASLRHLDNTKICPNDVHGEVHDDSEWFSAALWELREQYKVSDDDHWDIDAAIYSALLELPAQATYTIAGRTTIDQMESWFDSDAADFAEEVFTRRGVIDCNRAVPIEDGFSLDYISVYDTQTIRMNPFVPGMMQFHASLPDGGRGITMAFKVASGGGMFGGGSVDMDMLARLDQPVTFNYQRNVSASYDWDVALKKVGSEGSYDIYAATLTDPDGGGLAAGDWYFAMAIVSAGGSMMGAPMLYDVTFTWGCESDDDCSDCNSCSDAGKCVAPENECETDEDCEGLHVCVADGCAKRCAWPENACSTGRDCGYCEACNNGLCENIYNGCEMDEDCGGEEVCLVEACSGTCVPDGQPQVDGDLDIADGDDVDGDDNGGSGATGGGCSQSAGQGGLLMLLAGLLLALRRRARA